MNLRKQVESLGDAALQASSNRGMHTTRPSQLTWVKRWLKRAYRITRKAGSSNRHGNLTAYWAGRQETLRPNGRRETRLQDAIKTRSTNCSRSMPCKAGCS